MRLHFCLFSLKKVFYRIISDKRLKIVGLHAAQSDLSLHLSLFNQ